MTPPVQQKGSPDYLPAASSGVSSAPKLNQGSMGILSAQGRGMVAAAGGTDKDFLRGVVWKYVYQSIPTEVMEKPADPLVKEMYLSQPLVDFINKDRQGRRVFQSEDCHFTVGRRQTAKGAEEWFIAVATPDAQKFEFELNMETGTLSLKKTIPLPHGVELEAKELVPGLQLQLCQLNAISQEILLRSEDLRETPSGCR